MIRVVLALSLALVVAGCDGPSTNVVVDNGYPPYASVPLVVYDAYWQAVAFEQPDGAADPIPPGDSSEPQTTVPASANTAYVLLAPGWDPTSATPPTSFIVLQSQAGFAVSLGDTLHIPVDDTTFTGNCATGSFLTQAQADFITERVFAKDFVSLRYDAATCTTTPAGDAGSP
jgi:hypothetical protein